MAAFATVSDMRDTLTFAKTVEQSTEPIQVMKGGERKMVVLSNKLYERFEQLERQLAFEARVREAEDDTRAGRTRPITDVQAAMRAKYGA